MEGLTVSENYGNYATAHRLHGIAVRPKLRWVLSLGERCREYVRCFLATLLVFTLACTLPAWRLARIEFALQ